MEFSSWVSYLSNVLLDVILTGFTVWLWRMSDNFIRTWCQCKCNWQQWEHSSALCCLLYREHLNGIKTPGIQCQYQHKEQGRDHTAIWTGIALPRLICIYIIWFSKSNKACTWIFKNISLKFWYNYDIRISVKVSLIYEFSNFRKLKHL